MKKILVIQGNEDKHSLCSAIAHRYVATATTVGFDTVLVHISDVLFDPILHKGYKVIQPLENDLVKLQTLIKNSDHIVVVYPLWWSSMPALLKGLFDRIWLPHFAFSFNKSKNGKRTTGWKQLLKGKTCRAIVTLNNSVFLERLMYGDYTADFVSAICRFAGISTKVTEFGNVEAMTPEKFALVEKKIDALARKGA
jgi:NAD(P)H dehydrogenase (quinone)